MLHLFKKIEHLNAFLLKARQNQQSIGFVPTMGALHDGHLALIQQAQQENAIVVCSIFVNPTQFNDPEDLAKYPRPVSQDITKLESIGCTCLFLPEADEIYPKNLANVELDLAGLDSRMEGAHRPGHFAGVVQVVHRLLDIVQPDSLYMGQKDFQQFTIIQYMIRTLQLPVRLVRVPIIREDDGLAMSSRNVRLTEDGRIKASQLSSILMDAQDAAKHLALREVEQNALLAIEQAGLELDYLDIVNGDTLTPVDTFDDASNVVACATIRVDGIRLLDNVFLKES